MKPKVLLLALLMVLTLSGCYFDSNPTLLDEPDFEYEPPKLNLQKDIVMTFTGDVSFADNWHIMDYCKKNKCTPKDLVSQDLIDEMQNADVAHMNNEFVLSTRGKEIDKSYNFKGKPENAKYYNDFGIDFVTLANNHVWDYGEEAFLDTLDALDAAGVKYVGAGKNIKEASEPLYYEIDGRTIAFVAASRAEKTKRTPEATDTTPGILLCYDTTRFVNEIKEAKSKADFVVALVHWGTEDSDKLEKVQQETARLYIDAGADIIIGGHAHMLQGIEYYKNKPIVYNLGNFLFSSTEIDTAILKVTLTADNEVKLQLIPAVQKDCKVTSEAGTEKGKEILRTVESISEGIVIASDGTVTR